ncbi:MAG: hypothetical protein AAF903_06015 [Pseudomonadota bacterium]
MANVKGNEQMTFSKPPAYSKIFEGHDKASEMAEYARVLHAATVKDLKERSLLTPLRLLTADRYVRAVVEYEFSYSEAVKVGPVHRTADGTEYANQNWYGLLKLNAQIERFEKELMISPRAAGDKPVKAQRKKSSPADEFLDDAVFDGVKD